MSAPQVDAAIAETARALFLDLNDRPTARRQAAARAWRTADPAHEAAWQRVESAWHSGGALAGLGQARAQHLAGYLDRIEQNRTSKRRRKKQALAGGITAALVAGALWVTQPHLLQNLGADHIAPLGLPVTVALDDGSTVLLDGDSALAQSDTATERRVRLLRGGAYFEVRPDSRPFVVETPEGEIRVLGTGFDVQLLEDAANVTLVHGRVEVRGDTAAAVLEPGQSVQMQSQGLGPVEEASLESALAWRDGRYVYYNARLADVLGQIQRYRPGRIVVATRRLADERVSGSFALSDPQAALNSLKGSFGFRMVDLGRLTIISP